MLSNCVIQHFLIGSKVGHFFWLAQLRRHNEIKLHGSHLGRRSAKLRLKTFRFSGLQFCLYETNRDVVNFHPIDCIAAIQWPKSILDTVWQLLKNCAYKPSQCRHLSHFWSWECGLTKPNRQHVNKIDNVQTLWVSDMFGRDSAPKFRQLSHIHAAAFSAIHFLTTSIHQLPIGHALWELPRQWAQVHSGEQMLSKVEHALPP